MSEVSARAAIEGYVAALQAASPATINDLLDLCSDTVEFRDPFNHTTSRLRFHAALEHMFRQVADLRFQVHKVAGSGANWFLQWTFSGRVKIIGDIRIEGVSEIELDGEFKVSRHIDYWDATGPILMRAPVLGRLLWLVTRPMRLDTTSQPGH
ncbi:MAG: nuclear transport factor 2 family protein [Pseudomonadota bacterium]